MNYGHLTGGLIECSFDDEHHKYTIEGGLALPSVTQIMRPVTENAYRFIPRAVLDNAASLGTFVHACTELMDDDDLSDEDRQDAEAKGYLDAYEAWKRVANPSYQGIELRLACHSYAGTIDRVAIINGENWIVDLKTTSELHAHVGIQLAAYEELSKLAFPEVKVFRRAALQLKEDGTYRFLEYSSPLDKECFFGLLNLHLWRAANGLLEA